MNKNNLESTLKWTETYSDLVQFKFLVCGILKKTLLFKLKIIFSSFIN
jgi:hypothetical protein